MDFTVTDQTTNSSTTGTYINPYLYPGYTQAPQTFSLVTKLSEEQVTYLEQCFRAIMQEELAHAFALLVEREESEDDAYDETREEEEEVVNVPL